MNADRAQGLVASESLLRETLDYLMRLPVNPMTAQLARKIRTHLEDPAQAREVRDAALVINAAEQNRDLRSGVAWYTAAGLPALEVVVGAGCSVATIFLAGSSTLWRSIRRQAVLEEAHRLVDRRAESSAWAA